MIDSSNAALILRAILTLSSSAVAYTNFDLFLRAYIDSPYSVSASPKTSSREFYWAVMTTNFRFRNTDPPLTSPSNG